MLNTARQRFRHPVGQLTPPSDARALRRGIFSEGNMTRDRIIAANDTLRTCFSGGRVEVCHGPYDIDDRMMGRMLCAIAKYDNFPPDSLHDEGVLLFAGFHV